MEKSVVKEKLKKLYEKRFSVQTDLNFIDGAIAAYRDLLENNEDSQPGEISNNHSQTPVEKQEGGKS